MNRARVTQVFNQVDISNAQGGNVRKANAGATFAIPELLRTGPNSRAELIAPDKTVTRVGSNTVFSFKQGKRGINLEQGSVLFHSPTGKGGGEVKTASATASVLGTTIIVAATSNGGFKFMVLEGLGEVIMPNGSSRQIDAGNLTFIMPGGGTNQLQIFEFRLSAQTANSLLIQGFNNESGPIQSFLSKVEQQTQEQEEQIAEGSKEGTNLKIGDAIGDDILITDQGSRSALFEEIVAQTLLEGTEVPSTPPGGVCPPNPFDPDECPLAFQAFEGLCEALLIDSTTLDPDRVVYFDSDNLDELQKFLEAIGIEPDMIDEDDFFPLSELSNGPTLAPTSLATGSTITFDTPELDLSDQQPGDFAFLADSIMTFNQLLEVSNVPGDFLIFVAGGTIGFSNGSGVITSAPQMEFITQGLLGGTDLTFTNWGGGMTFDSSGVTTFSDTTFTFLEGSGLDFYGETAVEITDSSFVAYSPPSYVGGGTGIVVIGGGTLVNGGQVIDGGGEGIYLNDGGLVSGDDDGYSISDFGTTFVDIDSPGSILLENVDFDASTATLEIGSFDFSSESTDQVSLYSTEFNVDLFSVNASGDIVIMETAGGSSEHWANSYFLDSGEGNLWLQDHTINSPNASLSAAGDITLENVNLSDFFGFFTLIGSGVTSFGDSSVFGSDLFVDSSSGIDAFNSSFNTDTTTFLTDGDIVLTISDFSGSFINLTSDGGSFDSSDTSISSSGDVEISGQQGVTITGTEEATSHEASGVYAVNSGNGKITIEKLDVTNSADFGSSTVLATYDLSLTDVTFQTGATYDFDPQNPDNTPNQFASAMANVAVKGGSYGQYAGGITNGGSADVYYYWNAENGDVTVNVNADGTTYGVFDPGGEGSMGTTYFGTTDSNVSNSFNFNANMANGKVDVRNAEFLTSSGSGAMSYINMAANTVVVRDVVFGENAIVNLDSGLGGLPYFMASESDYMPGRVNLGGLIQHLASPTHNLGTESGYNAFQNDENTAGLVNVNGSDAPTTGSINSNPYN
ncbi:MAG: FecR family protein [Verrucomicrobiota bacterium]